MAPPPGKTPGDGSVNRSPTDEELEEMKTKAAMQAMMDDLGIARVEALPLANASRDRSQGAGAGAGANDRWRQPPPSALTAAANAAFRAAGAQRGWTVNDLWKDAMEAGVFKDDEARGVEKLTDLGGGRIYDTVKDLSVKILDHRTKRSFHPSNDPAPANKKVCYDDKPKRKRRGKRGQAGASTQPNQHDANTARLSAAPARPANPNPLSRPNRVPPPPAPPLRLPVPQMAVDLKAPLPFELPHVVFKTSAGFLSRDINPALPAIILLSATGRPEMGFFTVVLLGRKFCQWPISAWYDYSTGADLGLQLSFRDGHGTIQGYQLFFGTQESLMEFMATVRSLQAGDYLHIVDNALVPGSSPALAEETEAAQSNGAVTVQTAPPATRSATNASTAPAGAGAPASIQHVAEKTNSLDKGVPSSPKRTGEPDRAILIDFEANDVSSVSTQHHSESAELLSTLEPYSNNTDTSPLSTGMPQEAVLLMVRSLFQFFLCSQAGGTASTVDEFDAMAEAVKAGVLQHIMEGARAEGLSDLKIEALKSMINGVLAGVIRDHRATGRDVSVNFVVENGNGSATARNGGRRIRYTAEELLSMRHAAIEPPAWMADIPHLPRRGQRVGQARASTPSQASTEDNNGRSRAPTKRRPSIPLYQVRKFANDMDWAMGENSQPAPVTAAEKMNTAERMNTAKKMKASNTTSEETIRAEFENSPKIVVGSTTRAAARSEEASAIPSVASRRAVTDMGLQSSRWATGVSEVKHADNFTGPAYEKRSKRSYLEDLAQLDPETKVDVGAEDLTDFYFPMPDNTERRVVSASTATKPRAISNYDIQIRAPAGAATPRTDNIEDLRARISRLTIQSPRTARPRQGTGFSEQPSPLSNQFPAPAASVQPPSTVPTQPPVLPSTELAHRPVQPPPTESTRPRTLLTSSTKSAQLPMQPPSTTESAQSPVRSLSANPPTAATRPGLRGLGASRHCSDNAPASSGKFDFHLPGAGRK